MCGSEREIVGIIHVHSLWSEVGTGVEGSSLIPCGLDTRLGGSGEYPLLIMCKKKTKARQSTLSSKKNEVWFN